MTGMSLTLEMNQTLSQKQLLGKNLLLTQRLSLELYLELVDFFEGLYKNAAKETYVKHGMFFEYAVIRKKDLPKKVLEFGPGFAVFRYNSFDGLVDGMPLRFIIKDYLKDFPNEYKDIVAVHEYGESLAIGHKEASLLEWSVAQKEGILEPYLSWIEANFPCKLADLEYSSKLYSIMPEEICISASALAETSDEAKTVLKLIQGFDFPPEAKELSENYGAITNDITQSLLKAGNEGRWQIESANPDMVFLAAYLFHKKARDCVETKMDKLISTNGDIEKAWKMAIDEVSSKYSEQTLPSQHALAELLQKGKASAQDKENMDFYNIPFSHNLPTRFSFAMEIAKILKSKKKDNPEEIMKLKLRKASRIASGTLRITEDESMRVNLPTVIFYIKCLLFEAVGSFIESGEHQTLLDKGKARKFERMVLKLEREFEDNTGKKLFREIECKKWRNVAEIIKMNKKGRFQTNDEQKVVMFAGKKQILDQEKVTRRLVVTRPSSIII